MRYLVGVGNVLAGDDGVGPRVVEHAAASGLDRDVVAVDLATDALSLVAYLDAATEALLVVDAARLGLAPGDYRIFSPDEVQTRKELSGLTTHEGDAIRVVQLARAAGYTIPPLAVMGIEPRDTALGTPLSADLEARVPAYAAAAAGHLMGM
jgi:hydrogenase maturation protease